MNTTPVRLGWLQGLRAAAAAAVCIAHVGLIGNLDAFVFIEHLQAGVDVFFVLSGYVVMRTVARAKSASDFLGRRLWRIYPLYWLCTLGVLIGERMLRGEFPPPGKIVTSMLLWPDHDWPLLGVGWSLVHEMVFYATCATLLLARPQAKALDRSVAAWGIIAVFAAIWNTQSPATLAPWLNIVSHPLNLEFVGGAILARLHLHNRESGVRLPAVCTLVAGLAAISLVAVLAPVPEMHGLIRPLVYGVPALLIVDGLARGEASEGWRAPSWVCLLGDASYALYLIHAPILALLDHGLTRFAPACETWSWLFAALPLLQVVALQLHLRLEQPWMKRYPPSPSRR